MLASQYVGNARAPKGRAAIAQGAALGTRTAHNTDSPEGARQASGPRLARPFGATVRLSIRFPRAAPWAIAARPFGAVALLANRFAGALRRGVFSALRTASKFAG